MSGNNKGSMKEKTNTVKRTKKKLITIDDILTSDDVNKLFEKMLANKSDTLHALIIWVDRKQECHFESDETLTDNNAVGLLEWVKYRILQENDEGFDDENEVA